MVLRKKILIVDDSKTFHLFIAGLIGDQFELLHIQDPRLAIDTAKNFNPDLFLIDMEMPHLNGSELSKLITEHNILSSIPILIMTASFSDELFISAVESGASDILPKTSSASMIINKALAIIRQKELIQKQIEVKQLDAITALISISNHEFNNALFISNQFLKKAMLEIGAENINYKNLLKIKEMNSRMEDVVKKLSNVNEFKTHDQNESTNIPMLKI